MGITLPVLRRLIIPDPGMTLLDLDLSAADAQVVAWEANDEALKARFRARDDVHLANARDLWGMAVTPSTRNGRGVLLRDLAKLVHAINYGCKANTLAEHMGEPKHVAQTFINHWFSQHPHIRAWQRKVEFALQSTRSVSNAWGFRRIYTDRLDYLLPQALAWIGQSTVAITINKILLRVDHAHEHEGLPIQLLLQDHDNLVMQCPTDQLSEALPRLLELAKVPIPFPDPLVISASLKASTRSWADVAVPAISLTG